MARIKRHYPACSWEPDFQRGGHRAVLISSDGSTVRTPPMDLDAPSLRHENGRIAVCMDMARENQRRLEGRPHRLVEEGPGRWLAVPGRF